MIGYYLRNSVIGSYQYSKNQVYRLARQQSPLSSQSKIRKNQKNLIADDFGDDQNQSQQSQNYSDSDDNESTDYTTNNNSLQKSQNNQNQNELTIKKSDLMLHLPKTQFNPRFKPNINEERQHEKMAQNLYKWQQIHNNNPEKQYVIHDLPFQTYGEPHLGHFYNKTQQDIAARFAVINGYQVSHQLGFNLHGQTVQNQAILQEQINTSTIKRYTPDEIRDISQKYAYNSLAHIIQKMSRWGLMTDYSQAYTTNHPFYESGVLQAFSELVEEKSIYLDEKPLLWSVRNRNGLDDDEANMEIIPKAGTFIKFEVKEFGKNLFLKNLSEENNNMKVYVVGFTTELWTLNSLRALSVNENIQYGIYKFGDALYVISRNRYKHHRLFFREQKATLLSTQTGLQISQLNVFDSCFERQIPIIMSDIYGKNDRFGSGIACICPGHNSRDYQIAEKYNLSKKAYVTRFGRFDSTSVPSDLQNLKVTDGEADEHILQKYLENDLILDIEENYETETYFDKKTKEQLIVRTQMTVYSRLPDYEREYFVEQLKEKTNIKVSGQKKQQTNEQSNNNDNSAFGSLEEQILDKSDNWTISSNHEWGIPIPIFFYKDTNQQKYLIDSHIVKHIINLFSQFGSNIWYTMSVEELLPKKFKGQADKLEKGTFVFDQWFESGCSWFVMLKNSENLSDYRQQFLIQQQSNIVKKQLLLNHSNNDNDQNNNKNDNEQNTSVIPLQNEQQQTEEQKEFKIIKKYPCDLTIQGKDQIDSWLLSTSLLSISLKEPSFFNNLKLHRVLPSTNDEKLSKLSQFKSNIDDLIEGNIKLNGERQYGYGVDILRMWVAISDKVRKQTKDKKRIKENDKQALDIAENSDYIFLRPNEFDQSNNYINIIRKCMWSLLGTLKGYQQNTHSIVQSQNKMSFLNQFMMTQLVLFMINMHKSYTSLDYAQSVDLTLDFIKNWVYDFFLDSTKNNIISNPLSNNSQQTLFVYSKIVEYLLIAIGPLIPHNAEDIYSNIHFKNDKKYSLFHNKWPDMSKSEVESLKSSIPMINFFWEMRQCIWEQLTFQMERYQNIRSKERYEIVIIVDDVFSRAYQMIEDNCINELDQFIGAGHVKVHTKQENAEYPHKNISTFKYKGQYLNEKIEYTIKIYLSDYFKCLRCHKYTAIQDNTVCPHCIDYLTVHHKKECNHLLTTLKKNPNINVKIIDVTDKKLIQ